MNDIDSDPSDWSIRHALDYSERRALIDLFQQHIPHVEDTAVPRPENDHFWNPLVLVAVNAAGEIVGGLLSCRSPRSADLLINYGPAAASDPYVRNADRVSMLDLLAVDDLYRVQGIASALLRRARTELTSAGVRIWYGDSGTGLDDAALTRFYARHGFAIVPDNEPFPPFFGLSWDLTSPAVALRFWQRLDRV